VAKLNPIELQKHLKGLDYPAGRDEIVRKDHESGADDEIRQMLDKLPDRELETPAAVNEAIGDLQ
jgi:hypothetical protein